MSITVNVTSQSPESVRAGMLAVPVGAERTLGVGASVVDDVLGGRLAAFMTEAGFSGKPGETLLVPAEGLAAGVALLVGVGDPDEATAATLRRAAAAVARRAKKVTTIATTLTAAAPGLDDAEAARAVTEGLLLGAYQFLAYKTKGEATELAKAVLVGTGGKAVTTAIAEACIVADAVRWARDIVNEPSGTKSPAEFAAAAKKLLTGKGVKVTVLTEPQIKTQKMGGVLGVGQGSTRPPRFVKVTYDPPAGTRAKGTLALVGKGVTFDTGGISIKPADGMEAMKTDMGGAAAVLAAMSTLRDLGVRHRVVGYAPMVENMPSGSAIRPGDVLKIRDGQTVEVLNTDAEGRLILADALSWAVEEKVDAIVDLATLTGACVVALGEKVAGLMGNHDDWSAQVRAAADRAGEPMWPLPLPDDYKTQLDSEVADLRNIGANRYGGALTAGIFLESFVGDVPWVHLDIAGPARASSDDGELSRGGTGFGVRTLAELAKSFESPAKRSGDGKGAKSPTRAAKRSAPRRASRSKSSRSR